MKRYILKKLRSQDKVYYCKMRLRLRNFIL